MRAVLIATALLIPGKALATELTAVRCVGSIEKTSISFESGGDNKPLVSIPVTTRVPFDRVLVLNDATQSLSIYNPVTGSFDSVCPDPECVKRYGKIKIEFSYDGGSVGGIALQLDRQTGHFENQIMNGLNTSMVEAACRKVALPTNASTKF